MPVDRPEVGQPETLEQGMTIDTGLALIGMTQFGEVTGEPADGQ